MKANKLFQLLVVSGAVLAAGSAISVEGNSESLSILEEDETLAFCSQKNEQACEKSCSGEWQVKEGIVCCWGTSCGE